MRTSLTRLGVLLLGLVPMMPAGTVFYSGDLRTNATIVDCGLGCTLDPVTSTDGDYAQWAALLVPFTVSTPSEVNVVTFGWGGGTSATGAAVAGGGLEPYLSLFDSAGNFLASSFNSGCPPGGNFIGPDCFDVQFDAGILAPGNYQLALTAWQNLSFAENLGSGTLADGFTGLGNLGFTENLNYAFDLNIQEAPEPGTAGLLLIGACSWCAANYRKKRR